MAFSFLDFIFPKKCVNCGKFGQYFCLKCFSKIEYVENPVCPVCQRQAVGGKIHPKCQTKYTLDGLVVACRYRDPVKIAIQKIKYKWVYDIEKVLVDLLSTQIYKFSIPQKVILVPVPLHKKRKNWRGFNQAEILAKDLSNKFKVQYSEILVRSRETKTQVGLNRDERKENVKGAFELRQTNLVQGKPFDFAQGKIITEVSGKNIILVDDVYTSGATMAECAKVLKKSGAKSVWGMAVALG